MSFYIIEKWQFTTPYFVIDENGEVLEFETKKEAEKYNRKEINYGLVIELT